MKTVFGKHGTRTDITMNLEKEIGKKERIKRI